MMLQKLEVVLTLSENSIKTLKDNLAKRMLAKSKVTGVIKQLENERFNVNYQKTFCVPHLKRCGLFVGFWIPKKKYVVIEPQHKCCGFLFAIKEEDNVVETLIISTNGGRFADANALREYVLEYLVTPEFTKEDWNYK